MWGVVSVTPTTGSTTLVLVRIGVVSAPLLTSTPSMVALSTISLVTVVPLVLVIPPLSLVGTISTTRGIGVVTRTVAVFGALVIVTHQVGFRTLGEVLNAIFVSGQYEMLLPFSNPRCSPSHPQCRTLPISLMVYIGV